MNQMSRDICVHSWPCSYYLELEKRWVPGRLLLTSLSLKFMTDKTGDFLVSFPLAGIIEIKKEASHFIFSSITILEKDHVKHWFSSLQPSRNVVFYVVEHFWRELLLSQPGAAMEASSSPMTKGKELTGLMASSQKRLEGTARVLHHQGEQLDSIASSLDKMESDLDVADRLLTELESPSWWPFSSKLWKMPSDTKRRGGSSMTCSKALGKEGTVIRIPVVISQRTESHVKPGRLTVLMSGLEVHDSDSSLIHRFEREDVDDIKVHTPYEVSIRQRFIGKPDIAFHLISARMPEVIPILEMQFSKKVELLEDALMIRSTGTSSPAKKGYSVWQAGGASPVSGKGPGWRDQAVPSAMVPLVPMENPQHQAQQQVPATCLTELHDVCVLSGIVVSRRKLSTGASGLMDCTRRREPSTGSQEGRPLQLQTTEPLISKEDTQELREILGKMKGLALGAEAELERQDEALESIATAIDRTTLTIDKHTRRVKKLT